MAEIGRAKPLPLQKSIELNQNRDLDKQKLREVSDMYEQHFLKEMMKHMKSAQLASDNTFLKKNNAEKIFQEQLDEQYSKEWNKTGAFGLSDMLYEQLLDKFNLNDKSLEKPKGPIYLKHSDEVKSHPIEGGVALEINPVTTKELSLSQQPTSGRNLTHETLETEAAYFLESEESHSLGDVRSTVSVKSPWAGILQHKESKIDGSSVYRIKHDNGLESLISIQGSAGEKSRHLSVGDQLRSGEEVAVAQVSSPLFWTIKQGENKI